MKRPARPLWILLLIYFLFSLPLLAQPETGNVSPQASADLPAPSPADPARAATPQKVYAGIYLNKVVALDLKQNTYWMDFYVWFRWKGEPDPTATYELMNTHEKWGGTTVAESEGARKLADGWNYQEFHIEQQFYSPFRFNAYPLDEQILRITIEDKSHTNKVLQYLPDVSSSNYNPEIFIPGWKINKHEIQVNQHTYNTNFGQTGKAVETYSRLNFEIRMTRDPWTLHLFKLFLPIVIILVMVFVIFFIPISFFDSRVEIAITGLLSMIALQMVLNDALPPVGYLTLTDRIYYFSYFVVMCALIETVWVYFSFKRDEYLARRIDRISFR
ncbi:MAG: hypothetical protein CVV27_09590 [Candidatus Melainabacteria bacterium HGW-Melainabacteria-1]|nr:MAG: hypothetical protein CVV27_09590 [Candidatus Melainabacteria bacterium HGW-Melainabacteria-1]